MKCYFDIDLDAQGICQECGRFVSRRYSKIKNDKFVCVVCNLGGEEGTRAWIVQQIEETYAGDCEACPRKLYKWPSGNEFGLITEFELIFGIHDTELRTHWEGSFPKYRLSKCSSGCFQCQEHIKSEQIEGESWRRRIKYTCGVCGEEWIY